MTTNYFEQSKTFTMNDKYRINIMAENGKKVTAKTRHANAVLINICLSNKRLSLMEGGRQRFHFINNKMLKGQWGNAKDKCFSC